MKNAIVAHRNDPCRVQSINSALAERMLWPGLWGLASPAWGLAGACGSPRRVVYDADLQGLIGCLYTQGVATCFHTAFTAHSDVGAQASGSQVQRQTV